MDKVWTISWTIYGYDDGLNIHNLWNCGLCCGLFMDISMDKVWTISWTIYGHVNGWTLMWTANGLVDGWMD